jgi:DNA-binding response OmpR family regulator
MSLSEHPRILIADDESAITANLTPFLERSGFEITTVSNGQEAIDLIQKQSFDLVVFDILMPVLDGREALRRLRKAGNNLPVILLTQVGGTTERALALEEGADDYLNKPFDPYELLARIKAVLRRSKPGQPSLASTWRLAAGTLVFDRRARRVTLDGQPVILTPKALAVLEYMMTHPDELLTRERLLDAVWGWDYPAGTRTVDTRIAELRRALGDDASYPRFIETLAGEGYRFIALVRGG